MEGGCNISLNIRQSPAYSVQDWILYNRACVNICIKYNKFYIAKNSMSNEYQSPKFFSRDRGVKDIVVKLRTSVINKLFAAFFSTF